MKEKAFMVYEITRIILKRLIIEDRVLAQNSSYAWLLPYDLVIL